jgi:two-component system chemotaxis response regulator CheB
VIGVLLTGLLTDGTSGLQAIKHAVVQDPSDAAYSQMPQSAIRHVAIDHVLPLEDIPGGLVELVREPAPSAREIPEEIRVEALPRRLAKWSK